MKKAGTLKNVKQHNKVVDFTGPAIWTDVIFDFFNNPKYFDMKDSERRIDYKDFTGMTSPKKVGDVVVLPITSFSPGVQQMGAGEDDDPMAFVKHAFQGTFPNTIVTVQARLVVFHNHVANLSQGPGNQSIYGTLENKIITPNKISMSTRRKERSKIRESGC